MTFCPLLSTLKSQQPQQTNLVACQKGDCEWYVGPTIRHCAIVKLALDMETIKSKIQLH
jgi:hypothetical protein